MTNRNNQITSLFVFISFLFSSSPIGFVFAESGLNEQNETMSELHESKTEESLSEIEELENSDESNDVTKNEILHEKQDEETNDETINAEDPEDPARIQSLENFSFQAEDENTETSLEENKNTYIETGVSYAALNLVNILNSNIVNSNGLILFLSNLFNTQKQQLDLRNYGFLSESGDNGSCEMMACGSNYLNIDNTNDGHIENDIYVGANSGNNHSTSEGDSSILTGDAYASANIVNIANTNIVDSDYLILTFSSFGDWNGDVIFPGMEALQNLFGKNNNYNNVEIDNESNAVVSNTTDVSADTGNNSAHSENGSANIDTGNAHTNTNIFNQLNSNIFGVGNFSVIFRIHGDWIGDIFSLPEGMHYERNSDGLTFLTLSPNSDESYDSLVTDSVTIKNKNEAHIENNLIVTAVSGQNSIEAFGDADITTGNAYASANITNIANTNIVGKNWILAIIDIFGNWNGNISFGRPDLWIGEQIKTDGNVTNGSILNYTYTIMNNGDTTATNVKVVDSFDNKHVEFLDSSHAATVEGNKITWHLYSVEPGEVQEISYRAKVKNAGYGETEITNTVNISAHEPDENMDDNTDTASVVAFVRPPSRPSKPRADEASVNNSGDILQKLLLENSNNAPLLVDKETAVTYTIKLTNKNSTAIQNVVITDELVNPDGESMNIEVFEIGEMLPQEIVVVEYTVIYDESFLTGVYVNHAKASFLDTADREQFTEKVLGHVNFLRPTNVTSQTENNLPAASKDISITRSAPKLMIVPIAEAAFADSDDSRNTANLASVARFRTHAAFGSAMMIILLLLAYEVSRRFKEVGND